MSSLVRLVAVVITVVAASPAFAQPGAPPPPPPQQPPPPPQSPDGETQAGTVVIVSPQAPVVTGPVYAPGQPPGQTQPGQPAQPAPQNEPWSNVSHINGTPVKVGERSDYLYKWKTTNVSTDPFGWLFGYYDISISHAVHSNVAISAAASVLSENGDDNYNYQLSVPIYFRRVFSGPFLEVGISINNYSCSDCGAQVGPEILVGWHWTFDSGLNLALAVGAQRNVGANSDGGDDAFPAGYFRVGYAF